MFPLLPAEAHGGALNRTGWDGLRGSYAHVARNCPCLGLVGCFSIRGVLHLAEGRASQRSTGCAHCGSERVPLGIRTSIKKTKLGV